MKFITIFLAPLVFSQDTKDYSPKPDQQPPMKDGKCFYQEVVDINGVSQDELFKRASNWVVTAYVSAPDVINQQDPDQGRIVTKGYFTINYVMNTMKNFHTLKIEVKDGRYRYTVNELYFVNSGGKVIEIERHFKGYRKKVNKEVIELVADLKKAMATEAEEW